MNRSPLHQHVDTLPDLIRDMIDDLIWQARDLFPPERCRKVKRVFVIGCGDSYHAALTSELAFEQLAGLPCEPQTAMQFSRFGVGFLPDSEPDSNLLLGVSVSGQVSRTIEAVDLGRQAQAMTVALTGDRDAPLAGVAELLFLTAVPPLSGELNGLVVPGSRSYFASQLALYLLAIHLGQERGRLSKKLANNLRRELSDMAEFVEEAVVVSDSLAHQAAQNWLAAGTFVFLGSGPNYGTALFSAAKLLEASGDSAIGQDLEEWAHLQYFARQQDTPTFIISTGQRDGDRALEITQAARAIGRRLALITPAAGPLAQAERDSVVFKLHDGVRDCFSPLLTSIPALLFAAYRAQLLDEPYFRGFAGGRSSEGGGGISRIRSSHRITNILK
jgi:glucosamine--fructose-6-phosphate aminotransferase (isomerizing)